MSKILNKLNQFLHIIIPYSIVGVIVFLFILYIWAPELFYNSLPELIGTFIGAVLGFELGSIAERKSREEAEKLRIETERDQNIGESVNLLTMMLEENEENLNQLKILSDLNENMIPEIHLRNSSYLTIQERLIVIHNIGLIEKLHNVYHKLRYLNIDIDYLRQYMFFEEPTSRDSKPERYLRYQIRGKARMAITMIKEMDQVLRDFLEDIAHK